MLLDEKQYLQFKKEEKKVYNLLNKKFGFKTDENNNLAYRISQLDLKTKDLYLNYLLSFDLKACKIITWNAITPFHSKDIDYTGKVKELYDLVQKSYNNYLAHNDWGELFNKTQKVNNNLISIEPIQKADIRPFLNIMGGLKDSNDYFIGIQFANSRDELWFKINDHNNNPVGLIGLSKDKEGVTHSESSYNMFYYIFKGERNKGYATSATNLLMELINNKQIYLDEQDIYYDYKYNTNDLDIKIVNLYIRKYNRSSNKIAKNLNFKKVGHFDSVVEGKFVPWYHYQYIVKGVNNEH